MGELLLTSLLLLFLSDCVNLLDMCDLLIFFVNNFPFLLQSSNEFLSLVVSHKELLLVSLVFLFDLHLANHLIFVFDLVLDLLDILGHLSEVVLLKVVLFFVYWQFGGGQDVFNGVGNDVILV